MSIASHLMRVHSICELLHYSYKKSTKSRTSSAIQKYTFYCAQVRGEEAKVRLHDEPEKRRARTTMDRFECNGYLHVTLDDNDLSIAGIKITHHRSHCAYIDISMTDKVESIIKEMINVPASKVSHTCIINWHYCRCTESAD